MIATRTRKPSRPLPPAVPAIEQVALFAVRTRCTDKYTVAPLAAVLDDVRQVLPSCTLGQFHDCCRQLHAAGRIRLEAWTRAMAMLPSLDNAIFMSGEVMYAASLPV